MPLAHWLLLPLSLFWYSEANNPSLQYLRSQVEVANRKVKLSQAECWTKMSFGYMGEFVSAIGGLHCRLPFFFIFAMDNQLFRI
jgi:hypothetical protein